MLNAIDSDGLFSYRVDQNVKWRTCYWSNCPPLGCSVYGCNLPKTQKGLHMNQDTKNYFKRTIYIHGGMAFSQILLLCLGTTSIISAILSIVILEPFVLCGYLLIFGIKRKDGTRKRFKKITAMMTSLGYEDL
jgi:hypothetical protein